VILFPQSAVLTVARTGIGRSRQRRDKARSGQGPHVYHVFSPAPAVSFRVFWRGLGPLLGSLDGGEPRRIATLTPGTDSLLNTCAGMAGPGAAGRYDSAAFSMPAVARSPAIRSRWRRPWASIKTLTPARSRCRPPA